MSNSDESTSESSTEDSESEDLPSELDPDESSSSEGKVFNRNDAYNFKIEMDLPPHQLSMQMYLNP